MDLDRTSKQLTISALRRTDLPVGFLLQQMPAELPESFWWWLLRGESLNHSVWFGKVVRSATARCVAVHLDEYKLEETFE